MHGDRARLHQLVANLLDNAARHSPSGGTVTVRRPARRRTVPSSRSPTTGPGIAAGRPRAGLRTLHAPAARTGAAAPASAWRSPGGSPSCTAASSRWPSPTSPDVAAASARRSPKGTRHDQPAVPQPRAASLRNPSCDAVFGSFWPESPRPPPRLVVAASVAGLLGAVVLPFRDAGLGSFLVLMAVAGVVASADRAAPDAVPPGGGGALHLCWPRRCSCATPGGSSTLCVLAAAAVAVTTLTEGRLAPGVAGLRARGAVRRAARPSRGWAGR